MEDLVFQVCAIFLFESCKKGYKTLWFESPNLLRVSIISIFSHQSHQHLDVCQKGNLFICFQHPKFDTVTKSSWNQEKLLHLESSATFLGTT